MENSVLPHAAWTIDLHAFPRFFAAQRPSKGVAKTWAVA
jgi:hypothetical protein